MIEVDTQGKDHLILGQGQDHTVLQEGQGHLKMKDAQDLDLDRAKMYNGKHSDRGYGQSPKRYKSRSPLHKPFTHRNDRGDTYDHDDRASPRRFSHREEGNDSRSSHFKGHGGGSRYKRDLNGMLPDFFDR